MTNDWKKYVVTLSALSQLGCIFCVARGAKVKTPRGDRNIEDLRVGDEVTVVDPATRELHTALISHIRSAKRETARLVTSRGSLRVTTSHPLYDPSSNEWAPAGDWVLGLRTSLLRIDGSDDVTARVAFDGLDDVFDLSVDHPAHTFVADGVVVHNKKPPPITCSEEVFGPSLQRNTACECDYGSGRVSCDRGVATCSCAVEPQPTVAVSFQSRWEVEATSEAALLAGGWTRLACGGTNGVLSAMRNGELLVTSQGDGKCGFVEKVDAFPAGGTHFGSVFVDANVNGPTPVILLNQDNPQAVLLELGPSSTSFVPKFDAAGQPLSGRASKWSVNVTPSRRFEWKLEFVTATTYRFWPRLESSPNVFTAANFVSEPDENGERMSLEAWYAAGNTFGFTDLEAARVLSVGTAGEHGASILLGHLGLSTEGWLNPQSE